MKKSRLFIANIVLACVFALFFIISVALVLLMRSSFDIAEELYANYDWYGELYGYGNGGYGYDYDYGEDSPSDYEWEVYEMPVMKNASVKLLGTELSGQTAHEGYQYYSVKISVYNGGSEYLYPEYLNIHCEGVNEEDVYNEYSPAVDEDNWWEPFFSANRKVLPSCQTGEVELFVQIKDGTKKFYLYLDRSLETGDTQTLEISLD